MKNWFYSVNPHNVLNGFLLILFVSLLIVTIADFRKTLAQSPSQSWLIWNGMKMNSGDYRVHLYKVQDGQCSIYVAVAEILGGTNGATPVAVATGQGCK